MSLLNDDVFKQNYEILSGGIENKVRCVKKRNRKQVIKIYSQRRYKFDGNCLMRKYRMLQQSKILDKLFSKICVVNEKRTQNDKNYIIYNYIPGEIKWDLSEHDIKKIANVNVTINKINLENFKIFKYDIEKKLEEIFVELRKNKNNINNKLLKYILENKGTILKIVSFDAFCHGDFHPGNILWNNNKITGIIDWDNCCYGPKEIDIANIRFDLAIIYGKEYAEKYLQIIEMYLNEKLNNIYYYDLLTVGFAINKYKKWIITIAKELDIDIKIIEYNMNDYINFILNKIEHLNVSANNVIIDIHNGGPIIYNKFLIKKARYYLNQNYDVGKLIRNINFDRLVYLLNNKYPEYINSWRKSNVDIAVRTVGIYGNPSFSIESILYDLSLVNYLNKNTDWIGIIHDFDELNHFVKNKKKGYILAIESLENFKNNIERLVILKSMGISIAQLTYNYGNYIGSGCYDDIDSGLTVEGIEVVKKLNDLNIIIDLSHVGTKTSLDVLEITNKPVICTHTFSCELNSNKRGKNDLFFEKLRDNNGFAAITINPNLIGNGNTSIIETMLNHIEHIMNIIGVENVGIGTDWDGPMPDFLIDELNTEAKKVRCKNYKLNLETHDYNGMDDWNNIIVAVKNKFGNEIANKILGNNFYNFLKRNNF